MHPMSSTTTIQTLPNLFLFAPLDNNALFPTHSISGERYVYKFVCDPDALFQMALAENHRNALRAEAASVISRANSGSHSAAAPAAEDEERVRLMFYST